MDAVRPTGLPSGIRVLDEVGRGATSVVWRGRDRRSGRDVAIKSIPLPPDEPSRSRTEARFDHELRALARLAAEPSVLGVVAAGVDGRCCWIVTELAEHSLGELGRRSAEEVLVIADETAEGLAAAHRSEVVHGDVTPANVLWVRGRVVLADFGLAILQAGSGPAGALGATPGWAAPERLDGEPPTSASDVYGWGATVWTAATGERPPTHGPPDRRRVPRGLDVVIAAACEVDPGRRPSMSEVVAAVGDERRRRDRYIPGP